MFLSSCGELVGMTEVHLECGVYPLPNPPPVGEGTLVLLPPGEGLGRGRLLSHVEASIKKWR